MLQLGIPLPSSTNHAVTIGRLYGCSRSLAVIEAATQHEGITVVLTTDSLHCNKLKQEIEFFAYNQSFDIVTFPDWETLPYDVFSPHEDITSERISTLARLPHIQHGILILPVTNSIQRLADPDFLQSSVLNLRVGQTLSIDDFRQKLVSSGYYFVSEVNSRGEFSVRGSIVDFYPMGAELPYRMEWFDEEIDTIRTFDPETQTSIERCEEIKLLPAHEFPSDDAAIKRFRSSYRAQFQGDPTKSPIYHEVSQGNSPPGIEYYLPLFCESTATLFDYLPNDPLFVLDDQIIAAAEEFLADTYSRYEQRRHDIERPILPPDQLYLDIDDIKQVLEKAPCIQLHRHEMEHCTSTNEINIDSAMLPAIALNSKLSDPALQLRNFLSGQKGRILFTADSLGRREHVREVLDGFHISTTTYDHWDDFLKSDQPKGLIAAPLEESVILRSNDVTIISETQLFGTRVHHTRARKRTRDADAIIRNLTDLTEGAPVVHEDHGIGLYRGLTLFEIEGSETEFLTMEYRDGDKLYVPVSSLHLVSRYTGADADHAPLHKLGTDQWAKAKQKAAQKAYDVAAELLDVYARRETAKGMAFETEVNEYQAFAASFPFEETQDQQKAIDDVLADMHSDHPMDRVICGDVGFGKTEVAMRAAFIAVTNHRQVAVLVPTTLLAQQHFQNFSDRFAEWPVKIASLSRFNSPKQQKAIIEELADGKIDIVIGTHKLLGSQIKYKNLGLIIVDEEQRFGVRHKEKLKALRAEVDILTLTATPIPRTLNMSLAGLRGLSIIATPPHHRHAIKTFVSQWNENTIKEACLREIKRGGQIYFLHNEIKTIDKVAKDLSNLLPQATINVAHGQMPESQLEQVMLDFYHLRFSILVSTTIIESGIDIPTANTIIINRADKLGLSQLHQLRGRVGRSHHKAYAYLITPPKKAMSADAVKRIDAIEAHEDLGVGFTLATHDLEIRGAGELLGEEQSGQIQEVGYTLYNELLTRAVQALKNGQLPSLDRPLDHGTEVDLSEPALLPPDYVHDVHTRLVLYKRIASSSSFDELKQIQIELIDRFGLLPEVAQNLFATTEIKLLASNHGILKVEVHAEGGRILFAPNPQIEIAQLLDLLSRKPQTYSLRGEEKLLFSEQLPTLQSRYDFVKQFLDYVSVKKAA